MDFYPAKLFTRRVTLSSALASPLLILYLCATFLIFFKAVIPSYQSGTTSEAFAVDSTVYTEYAESLREGRANPLVLEDLSVFPNTLWTPVLISYLLNSAFLELLLNLVLFTVSIVILVRALPISPSAFLLLLALNATTMTSILCVNKEVLDLLCLALFLYSQARKSRAVLLLALGLALLNRFEFCLVLLGFMLVRSRFNPWRERRFATLMLLLLALNFLMPIWAAHDLAKRFEEAEYGGVIRVLDELQLNYLYVIAVIPKIADNLFSAIVNPAVWSSPNSWLYINLLDNLAYVALFSILTVKGQLKLRSDLIYLGAMGAILVAQSMVFQPRYFYFLYVLLCLQASYVGRCGPAIAPRDDIRQELVNA